MKLNENKSRTKIKMKKKLEKFKFHIFFNICLILIFTCLAITSATINKGNGFLIRETIAAIIGMGAYFVI